MSDVSRFGVFLPSYVWDGDGPERARGIKEFAQTVEDLGFDSLFITDHLLVGKRFYSVNCSSRSCRWRSLRASRSGSGSGPRS